MWKSLNRKVETCLRQKKKIVQISVEVKNQILSDKHMYIGASRCATILEFFLNVFFQSFSLAFDGEGGSEMKLWQRKADDGMKAI